MRRPIARSLRLSLQAAINAVPRIPERVELTLWQLGDRFGHVTAEGIVLRLALTHERLGELVAAQRPSVTTALRNLEARHRLLRRAQMRPDRRAFAIRHRT
jgi:CRP-like cAMP-binding protein